MLLSFFSYIEWGICPIFLSTPDAGIAAFGKGSVKTSAVNVGIAENWKKRNKPRQTKQNVSRETFYAKIVRAGGSVCEPPKSKESITGGEN